MTWLLSPLNWLVLAGLLLFPALRLRSGWPIGGCIAVAAIAAGAMTPLVANLLVAGLERPVGAGRDCALQPAATIVVLAGGLDGKPRGAGDFGVLGISSRRRIERAVQYWRQQPGRRLVLTGTSGNATTSDAVLMAAYAGALGVPRSVIRIEPRAETTWQNARRVARMSPRIARRITLATSAIHMRRAAFAFRSAGFLVCPLPTDFRVTATGFPGLLWPASTALRKTEEALHEVAGLALYHWRARPGLRPLAVRGGATRVHGVARQ